MKFLYGVLHEFFVLGIIKNMKLLSFKKTEELLEKYKIPVVETRLVKTKKEAKEAAKKFWVEGGWRPMVLKIASPEVLHRTERGLVKIGIQNEKELTKAFDEILKNSKKIKVEGILVQKMAKGIEIACGMKRDASFGPVLMFGLGGVFIEVLKDVSFQIAPVSKREAGEMVKKYTGRTRANLRKIVGILIQLSKLALENPEIKEIDFNPVFCDEKKARVADFKIII